MQEIVWLLLVRCCLCAAAFGVPEAPNAARVYRQNVAPIKPEFSSQSWPTRRQVQSEILPLFCPSTKSLAAAAATRVEDRCRFCKRSNAEPQNLGANLFVSVAAAVFVGVESSAGVGARSLASTLSASACCTFVGACNLSVSNSPI